jgi:hypothetical protein
MHHKAAGVELRLSPILVTVAESSLASLNFQRVPLIANKRSICVPRTRFVGVVIDWLSAAQVARKAAHQSNVF